MGDLLMLILAPIAAMLIQLAVSRSREYGADENGARLVGYPDGLARALAKLKDASERIPMQNVEPATAQEHYEPPRYFFPMLKGGHSPRPGLYVTV